MVVECHKNGGNGRQNRGPVLFHSLQHLGEGGITGPGVGDAHQAAGGQAGPEHVNGLAEAVVEREDSQEAVNASPAQLFRLAARFLRDLHPLIERHDVEDQIGVGQGRTLGYPGRSARVNDHGQILFGIDVDRGRLGTGLFDDIVEEKVAGSIIAGLGDLAEQAADKRF